MTTKEFFEAVFNDELSIMDIYHHIKKVTDDHDYSKLYLLFADFEHYHFHKKEELVAKISDEEIKNRKESYLSQGIEPPKPIETNYLFDYSGEYEYRSALHEMEIGYEFFPEDIERLKKIESLLLDLLANNDPQKQHFNKNHIHWYKRGESLKQFIEALIEQNLIEKREPEDIIKDHFEPVSEQNKEPEPIKWLNTQTLLAYMIDELNKNHIQTNNIWEDTAPHFSVNGQTPKNLRQSAKNYKDNKTGRSGGHIGKPKNHQLIDDILQHLPE